MIILKHVEYRIKSRSELERLSNHLRETTSRIPGVTFQDVCFPKGKKEFVVILNCTSEDRYLEWREICPPPPAARDWYEVFLVKDEFLTPD